MKFDDLREYFKTYIKKYTPYQGDRVYDVLVDYILEQYLNDQYTNIPEGLKALYEDNILSESIFNQLLFAVGVHEDVIKKMKVNDKRTFITALSSFQRYKGSVKLFRQIGGAYNDRFNVYELYVDFAEGEWILRPYMIFEGVKNLKTPLSIPYAWAYQSIPTLFVSPEQLDYYRANKLAAFPLKTNIISLQYSMEINCSEMITLSLKTFLKDYGATYITIYHRDTTFSLQLKHIYYIWTYILAKFYGAGFYNLQLTKMLLYLDESNPYSLQDIDNLWKEYDSLDYSFDLYAFYKEHFLSNFETFYKTDELTPNDMGNIVLGINKQYYDYLINRLEDPEIGTNRSTRMTVFNEFTNEIFDSLLLYQDNIVKTSNEGDSELFLKYFDMLLNSLSHIIVDPKETISYLLMYNFKPYHTEFLTEGSSAIIVDDKFNSIAAKDEHNYLFSLIKADYLDSMMTYIDDFSLLYSTTSHQASIDKQLFSVLYNTISDNIMTDMDDYIKSLITSILIDVQEVSEQFISKIEAIQNSEIAIIDNKKIDYVMEKFMDPIMTFKLLFNNIISPYEHQGYLNNLVHDYELNYLIDGNLNVKDRVEVFLT